MNEDRSMVTRLPRRRFLGHALAGTLALPALPSLVAGDRAAAATPRAPSPGPRRFVAIGNLLGFQRSHLFPEKVGTDFELTDLLEPLADNRGRITLFRGLDHGIKGGHFAVHTFLSGVLHHESKYRPDGNVTVDQFIADAVGDQTRFASLTVGSEGGIHGGCQLSWTRSGVRVPPITCPSALFEKLFVGESPAARERYDAANRLQGSILDAMISDARTLARRINHEDRAKLDDYLTSVRDVEKRLQARIAWANRPKPTAPMKRPSDRNTAQDLPLLYELIALALQTDSTRVATLEIGGCFLPQDLGIDKSHHGLSHHGNDPEAVAQLITLEKYQLEHFSRFLTRLAGTTDGDSTLLDSTAVLFGSGMGDANSHKNDDLPIIMAGAGYGCGAFRRLDPQRNKVPLCNLFLDIVQRLGIEADSFGTSTGTFS